MPMFNTIIFDMDGTVLDTLEDMTDSINHAMALYGFPAWNVSQVKAFVGNGIGRMMERCVPGGKENPRYKDCLAAFKTYYEAHMQIKTRPYDGILELMSLLSGQGYKMAIVSNKFDEAVRELTPFYFGDFVSVAVGEGPGVVKKPAPDTVFRALEALGAAVDEAVYVGDTEVDAETAGNAGLPFVGVTWGFRSRDVLAQCGARRIIDKPEELISVLSEDFCLN